MAEHFLPPASIHSLPVELIRTLGRRADDIQEVVEISGLRGKSQDAGSTYRLTFRDGNRLKARRLEPTKDIDYLRAVNERLPSDRFPRIVASGERVILEEWFAGEPVSHSAVGAAFYRDSGRLLARIHATPTPCGPGRGEAGRRDTVDCRQRLESALLQLLRAGHFDAATASAVHTFAIADQPQVADFGLIHRDFCGENLLVRERRACAIDNVTFASMALDEDLARTWYRWPLAAADWQAFLQGYREGRNPTPYLRHARFWQVLVLTGSIALRLRIGLKREAAIPTARLLGLIERESKSELRAKSLAAKSLVA